jgi:hypothetical protein
MAGHLARFMRQIMRDISKAPARVFQLYYYPRVINDECLSARIRGAALPGRNIFLLGRTGEGKTCFLRNYQINNPSFEVGFGSGKKKDISYLPIEFDTPEWRPEATDEELLAKIVRGLEKYLLEYDLLPHDYDRTTALSSRYHLAVKALNELEFQKKRTQLVVFIDDIDHAPVEFQIRFLNAIYPLLRSPGCVCVYAVRPPAYSTALTRASGKLATVFLDFDTVELRPLAIKTVANHRAKATLDSTDLRAEIEEPDLSLKGFQYQYLVPDTIDNFVQQYCCGNLRTMSKLLVRFTDELEKLRETAQDARIGRTRILELMRSEIFDIFAEKNSKGFSPRFSVLQMLKMQNRIDERFYSVLAGCAFDRVAVDACLAQLYEHDVIEESLVADSYARMIDAEAPMVREYVLTKKGNWLMNMAEWPQYRQVFVPPKRTLTQGGEIFDRRVFAEFTEMLRDMLLASDHRGPVIRLDWPKCFEAFSGLAQPLPRRAGAPNEPGFAGLQLYRIVEKEGIVDKKHSKYPKVVAINRVEFERACRLCGLGLDSPNPFGDAKFIGEAGRSVLVEQ